MLRLQHFMLAIGHHEEQAHTTKARGEMRQDIDRRQIGPMKIVDENHQGLVPRRVFQEDRQLFTTDLLNDRGDVAVPQLLLSLSFKLWIWNFYGK